MWMSNMRNNVSTIEEEEEEEEEAWELARAFAEDTTRSTIGIMPKWPPRSYTCTFCRREFRSAQALGGHMNVHRRDRALLHHQQSTVQAQTHQAQTAATTGPTTLLHDQLFPQCRVNNTSSNKFDVMTSCHYNKETTQEVVNEKEAPIEELDLELRLGCISTPTSHEKLFQKNNSSVSLFNFR